jgi:transcriptional regulator with XRE-family HTH domain
MADGRTPNPVDVHVGERVRMRRVTVRMSQAAVAKKLGLTFQQVQKYERGTNRIGASRLHQLAEILEVPVSFFFEDLPGQKRRAGELILPRYLVEFMGTAQGQRVAKALGRVSDQNLRIHLVRLIERIADNFTPAAGRAKRRKPA